jgi:multidrug transporter EmrE-like cation transporter
MTRIASAARKSIQVLIAYEIWHGTTSFGTFNHHKRVTQY